MQIAHEYAMSEDDYLALEARSPERHEYVLGNVYAMTGASLRHNIIAGNVYSVLRAHLRGSPCRTFMSDAKLRVAKTKSYYYPDVMVTCDPRHQSVEPGDTVVDTPRLVVEVLSERTEATDRREKLLAYRSLPSLQEYVLIAQEEARIEIHRREGDIGWQIITLTPGDPVAFASVEWAADFATVYEESGIEL
jgi:Uma2 family endonuclease